MAYPDPPTTPPIPQRGDRATFSSRVDAFLMWVAAIIPWLQGYIENFRSSLTMLAAGGANSFSYIFDSTTSDADPGPGRLRLNSSTQNSANVIRIDDIASGGVDVSGVITSLMNGTSSIKGSIRLQKLNEPNSWLLFDVSSGSGSGYRNISVIPRASSSTSPFLNGDTIIVSLERNGDSGTVPGATELLATIPVPSGVSAINALNVFDTDHDWYFMHFMQISVAAISRIDVRLAVAGALVSNSTGYWQANANADAVLTGARSSSFRLRATGAESPRLLYSGTLQVGDVNSSNSKEILWDGTAYDPTNNLAAQAVRGVFLPSGVVTGFGLILDAATTFTGGTIRVYGVRKS